MQITEIKAIEVDNTKVFVLKTEDGKFLAPSMSNEEFIPAVFRVRMPDKKLCDLSSVEDDMLCNIPFNLKTFKEREGMYIMLRNNIGLVPCNPADLKTFVHIIELDANEVESEDEDESFDIEESELEGSLEEELGEEDSELGEDDSEEDSELSEDDESEVDGEDDSTTDLDDLSDADLEEELSNISAEAEEDEDSEEVSEESESAPTQFNFQWGRQTTTEIQKVVEEVVPRQLAISDSYSVNTESAYAVEWDEDKEKWVRTGEKQSLKRTQATWDGDCKGHIGVKDSESKKWIVLYHNKKEFFFIVPLSDIKLNGEEVLPKTKTIKKEVVVEAPVTIESLQDQIAQLGKMMESLLNRLN